MPILKKMEEKYLFGMHIPWYAYLFIENYLIFLKIVIDLLPLKLSSKFRIETF